MFYRTPVNWGLHVSTYELLWISAEHHASTTHDPVNSEDGRRARDTQAGLMSRRRFHCWSWSRYSQDFTSLDMSFGLGFSFYQKCAQSPRNRDESVEVCLNNDQITGFSKHYSNSPPPKAERFIVCSFWNRLLDLLSDRILEKWDVFLEPLSTWKLEV